MDFSHLKNSSGQLAELNRAVSLLIREEVSWIQDNGTRLLASVSDKSSSADLVTALDQEVQTRLHSGLSDLLPTARFWGEEQAVASLVGRDNAGYEMTWVVDPIDGTTNMVHGVPHVSMSIALTDGCGPLLGFVAHLFTGDLYRAQRGQGAFVELVDGSCEPLRVSATTSLSKSLISFGIPYDRSRLRQLMQAAERATHEARDLRRMGSAALDIAAIARGWVDAHFELDLRVWDIAAAGLILAEAGGSFTDWDGQDVSYRATGQKQDVLASNGKIGNELGAVLKG